MIKEMVIKNKYMHRHYQYLINKENNLREQLIIYNNQVINRPWISYFHLILYTSIIKRLMIHKQISPMVLFLNFWDEGFLFTLFTVIIITQKVETGMPGSNSSQGSCVYFCTNTYGKL